MIGFILMLIFMLPAHARTIVGIDFDESMRLADYGQSLKLNGLGVRYKFFFKIYIAALYVERMTEDANKVLTDTGAKRMVMHFLYDEVSRDKLIDAWNEGFEGNLSEAQLQRLSSRIEQFNDLFTTVVTGDVVVLDFIPGIGTRMMLNDVEQGVIQGDDFNRALLSIWLGQQPVTDELKNALLGRAEE